VDRAGSAGSSGSISGVSLGFCTCDARVRVQAAVGVGLLQAGLQPATGESRYLASPLLRPFLDSVPERLDEDELQQAHGRGARFLYQRWVDCQRGRAGEVFRLGEAAVMPPDLYDDRATVRE
jgi:hypothetical protein